MIYQPLRLLSHAPPLLQGKTYNIFKTFSFSIQRSFPSALISHFSSLPISAPKCCSPHLSGSLIPNQLQTAQRKEKKTKKKTPETSTSVQDGNQSV